MAHGMGRLRHEFAGWERPHTFSTSLKLPPTAPWQGGDEGQRAPRKYQLPAAPTAWERPAAESTACEHAAPHARPLLTQEVCMAHGADAHLHSIIEGIAAVLSTCSGSVWSTPATQVQIVQRR